MFCLKILKKGSQNCNKWASSIGADGIFGAGEESAAHWTAGLPVKIETLDWYQQYVNPFAPSFHKGDTFCWFLAPLFFGLITCFKSATQTESKNMTKVLF